MGRLSQKPLLKPSPTMLLAMAIPPTATTERDQLMLRPRLSHKLGTMAATAMDGLHMAMDPASTERGLLMPRLRLSPTTPMATPHTATATTERGLLMPRLRLSPTTMATP